MPEISRFYGIVIRMFHREHAPPHLHAQHGEYEITVDIESLIIHGEVFEPLRDVNVFQSFRVEGGALEWPDGASFSPEFLHDHIRVTT